MNHLNIKKITLIFLSFVLTGIIAYPLFFSTFELQDKLSADKGFEAYGKSQEVTIRKLQKDFGIDITNKDTEKLLKIIIGGDVMLARSIGEGINNNINPFSGISDVLKSADFSIINLECVVSDKGSPYPGKLYTFEAPITSLEYIKSSGIDMVSVANNHSGDFGIDAFSDMLDRLKSAELLYVGGGKNETEAYTPKYFEAKNIRIAFLAFSNVETSYFAAGKDTPGIAWYDEQKIQNSLNTAKANADIVIVYNHMGVEYKTEHNQQQQQAYRKLIDMGADLVVGAHPHVRQASENYKGRMIYYSIGNLVFDKMNSYDASHSDLLEIIVKDGKISTTNLIPVELSFDGYPKVKNLY